MSKKVPYLIVAPGLVLLLFFLMIPLIISILPAIFTDHGLTLDQHITFFEDDYSVSIFWRMIKVSLIMMGISIALGVPTVYLIARVSKRWRDFLVAMTLPPLLTNSAIRSFAWINILGENDIVNTLLLKTSLIEQPLSLLYTEFTTIIGSMYLFLPTMITTLVGVMENIEGEMLEAAETLGVNPMVAFQKIVLPLSIPGTVVRSILVFTGTLAVYTALQLLDGNQKMMVSTFLYQKANTLGDWQSASVLTFVMILTTLIVVKGLDMVAKKVDRREANHA